MNSPEFKDTVCRICLDESELFDWKNTLEGHDDVTYKDCYYKYTQIEQLDTDPFSTMLCQNCLHGLQNVHEFILKALDSYNFLLEVNGANSEIDTSIIETYDSNEFETVLVEKPDTESAIEDHYEFENSDEEFMYSDEEFFMTVNTLPEKRKNSQTENLKPKSINIPTSINNEKDESAFDQSLKTDNSNVRRSKRNNTTKSTPNDNDITKIKMEPKIKQLVIRLTDIAKNKKDKSRVNQSFKADNSNVKKPKKDIISMSTQDDKNITTKIKIEPRKVQTEKTKVDKKTKSKYNKKEPKMDLNNTPCMCSICSRILHNKYALKKHEKTHVENRERKVPCPICGVKFFDRANVVNHMHIHDEKREKKHKCEFCGKAFYAKGILNVHRRVHLGQMLSCTICEKQFYRQVDLDIHMNRHSAIAINGVTKKRSRYLVQCQYCDKKLLSTNYKAHAAAHLNQPLVKCLICDKEFFSRGSCKDHVKQKHDKKTPGDWDQYILSYDNKRLSHLLLEQTTKIIPTHK